MRLCTVALNIAFSAACMTVYNEYHGIYLYDVANINYIVNIIDCA